MTLPCPTGYGSMAKKKQSMRRIAKRVWLGISVFYYSKDDAKYD
jgi:hypothetical protein